MQTAGRNHKSGLPVLFRKRHTCRMNVTHRPSKLLPDALASSLVLVVLDGSKLPTASLSEKLDLLLKESSQFDFNLRDSVALDAGLRAAHLRRTGNRAGAGKSERTEAASPQNRGRASVSRVPPFSRAADYSAASIRNLHNRHGFRTGTPGRKMPHTQREGKSPVPPLVENISKATGLSRASIRTEHAARYRSLFRCSLLHSVNQNEEHHYCENAGNDPD
jgi:hypothetical protein